MKQFYSYMKPYWREMILSPILKLIEALLELLVPLILAGLIDQVLQGESFSSLLPQLGYLVALAFLGVVVALTAQYYAAKASVHLVKDLSDDLFEHISFLPVQSRQELTQQKLLTTLTADTLQVQTGLNLFLRLFLRAPIIVFGAVVMAFSLSPRLALIFLGMVAILFVAIYGLSLYAQPSYQAVKGKQEMLIETLDEHLSGFRLIRAFNQGKREQKNFTQTNQNYQQAAITAANRSTLINPTTYFIVNLALLILLWQGRLSHLTGLIGAGSLVALVNYLLQILQELLKLTTMIASLNQSLVSLKRIKQIFEMPRENLQTELVQREASFAYQLDQVSLTYHQAEEAALKELDLTIPKGMTLAITGSTGSGKSSLLNLLAGLLSPSQGQVKLGQWSGHLPTLNHWREQVSFVAQKNQLLSGSLRSYLTLVMTEEASDDRLWWALELAQAKDFIKERQGQLDTEIAPYGQNFSGGQKQRLAIAKSLLAKKSIIIWDDVTSALDYVTEHRIITGLRQHFPEVTLIMVTQRIKTLQSADKILVLDKGRLAGFGQHQELLMTSTLYRQFYLSQTGKEALDA